MEFPEHTYNDDEEVQYFDSKDVLNYIALDSGDLFDPSGYDVPHYVPTAQDSSAKGPLRSVLGPWCGFLSEGNQYPCEAMISLDVHALDETRCFEVFGRTPNGTSFTLTGEHSADDERQVCYTFAVKYAARFSTKYFRGCIQDSGSTFAGTWGLATEYGVHESSEISSGSRSDDGRSVGVSLDSFIFKRLPSTIMCCHPPPTAFVANRPRALWQFALHAVHGHVSRQLCSWTFFKRRRDSRKRYVELLIRFNFGRLNEQEGAELAAIRQRLTTTDARLYETIYDYELTMTPIHLDIHCDSCNEAIIGPRIVCLDCDAKKTVNLCYSPYCRDTEIDLDKRPDLPLPHLPSHSVFKVRTMMHHRELGKTDRAAREALQKATAAFRDAAEMEDEQTQGSEAHDCTARIVQTKLACIVCKERGTAVMVLYCV